MLHEENTIFLQKLLASQLVDEGGAMVRADRKCEAYVLVLVIDVGWKRRGGEAEKRMVLDASCDPLWEWKRVSIHMK